MKILHIDETFHPAFGYQCNPLAKFQSKQGHEVYILAPEAHHIHDVYKSFGETGAHLEEQDRWYERETGVQIVRANAWCTIAHRLLYRGKSLFGLIDDIHPDVMLVHCVETLTAMRVLRRYDNKVPMVFDSHMLAMASSNPLAVAYEKAYKLLISSRLIKGRYTVIRTQDDPYVNDHLGLPRLQTPYISFGTDTDLFSPNDTARATFLESQGLEENSFVVVSTGKLSQTKGGLFFAESIKESFSTVRPVVFVIVANLDGEYEHEVERVLNDSNNRIIFYPVQQYQSLPFFYQIADAVVFPKQCSMSFYDAQACGCPVISEGNNVNLERNSHGNGLCFTPDSPDSLREAISMLANAPDDELSSMRAASRNYVLNGFSYEQIAKEYSAVLQRAVDRARAKTQGRCWND